MKEIQTIIFRPFHLTVLYSAILEGKEKKNKANCLLCFFLTDDSKAIRFEAILDLKVSLKSNGNDFL